MLKDSDFGGVVGQIREQLDAALKLAETCKRLAEESLREAEGYGRDVVEQEAKAQALKAALAKLEQPTQCLSMYQGQGLNSQLNAQFRNK